MQEIKILGLFYHKLLFYSVISNYHTSWLLGRIKKTHTVSDRGTYKTHTVFNGKTGFYWYGNGTIMEDGTDPT